MVGETLPSEADKNSLAAMMVGRDVNLVVEKKYQEPGDIVLEVKDLTVADKFQNVIVDNVSLDVRAGEILGIAGVQGNGQTELVEVVTGLRKMESGSVTLFGQNISNASPRKITELGSAHIPEDRQADGLVLPFPIAETWSCALITKNPSRTALFYAMTRSWKTR